MQLNDWAPDCYTWDSGLVISTTETWRTKRKKGGLEETKEGKEDEEEKKQEGINP